MYKINCVSCNADLGEHYDEDMAIEQAQEAGAHFDGGDEGSHDWNCIRCVEQYEREMMNEHEARGWMMPTKSQFDDDAAEAFYERADNIISGGDR